MIGDQLTGRIVLSRSGALRIIRVALLRGAVMTHGSSSVDIDDDKIDDAVLALL